MKCKILCSLIVFSFISNSNAEFSDNLRWSVDASIRLNKFNLPSRTSKIFFLGIDTHKVFTSKYGDVGYAVAQLYWTKLDNHQPVPFMFDSPDDQKFIIREAHINYTATGNTLPNIRLGHFTLPFGLENSLDTNGRLLDYNLGANLGTKLDWGIGLNKVHDHFKYTISYTLGGKDDPKQVDGSHLVTGRISSLAHHDLVFGASFYHGKLDNKDRERYGIDLKYYLENWGLLAELAKGNKYLENNTKVDQSYGLIELNRSSLNDQWKLYSQLIFNKDNAIKTKTALFGIRYQANKNFETSLQFKKKIKAPDEGKETSLFRVQLRYRY